jgi:hypothetical protein
MTPWWWFLREPKHVGMTVGIFNCFNILVILWLCASLWKIRSVLILLMHGTNMKIINAQQARICKICKSTRLKLLKINASLWFNKMCKTKNLKPKYIHFKTNAKTPQDRKTMSNAVRFRINQEIKFLYCKKQNLNVQLYRIHLDCANQCNNVWQHIQNSIDDKLNDKMDTLCQNLNQKLDNLIKQSQTTRNDIKNTNTPPRLINLTNTTFTKEHNHILTLGPKYALTKTLKITLMYL